MADAVFLRKKFAKMHELILVSYHEAGHAVYGLLNFMKIDPVLIFEAKKPKLMWGLTHFSSVLDEDYIIDEVLVAERVRAEICIQYAGLAAEKHLFKLISGSDKLPMSLKQGAVDDTAAAASLIKKYNLSPPGKKRYIYKKNLIKETSNQLYNNWEDVTLVAHALFEKKKLNFSELQLLLNKKSKNKSFWKEQFKTINYLFDNKGSLDIKEIKSIFLS